MDRPEERTRTDEPPTWLWPLANGAGIVMGIGAFAMGLWYCWDFPTRLALAGGLISTVCGGGGYLAGLVLVGIPYQIWRRLRR